MPRTSEYCLHGPDRPRRQAYGRCSLRCFLRGAGFTLVDPDSITVGASYFDVSAGDWVGQVVVGEMIDGDQSFATVQWFLTRP